MKKTILLFCFLTSTLTGFAQSPGIDTILQKIAAEKDDEKRIQLIVNLYITAFYNNPGLVLQNAQMVLAQAQKNNDKIGQSLALSHIASGYRQMGNTIKGLEYGYKALNIAVEVENFGLIANDELVLGNIYKDRGDYAKSIQFYLSAEQNAAKQKEEKLQEFALINLGQVYLKMNKLDSALTYSQKGYEFCIHLNRTYELPGVLTNLGGIHGKIGNQALAVSYFQMAIKEASKEKWPRELCNVYTGFANYYNDNNQYDSSIVYAKKAIGAVQNTSYFTFGKEAANLLAGIYEKTNADTALKYYKLYTIANDSLFNVQAVQQAQTISFEEEQRKQESSIQKIKAEEDRKQNIQYALIAIGIITFIGLFLLLSRSFITNTKMIEFFGVIALLLVFEFLNLLLHPFLERVTEHSPLLMLLSLVCIAALLVPLHHRTEKWATQKMIEKNKRIRLAAAKKTIEQLEGKADTL